jgi:hypothetical protein
MAHKPVADSRHCRDEARLPRVVSQQPPQQGHGTREGVFRNRRLLPDRIQKFVLGHQPVRVAQQVQQDAEGLRLNRNRVAAADETELSLSKLELTEAKDKALLLRHEFITCLQGMIRTPS